jgi:restriction endonuclease Mrr
MRSTRQWDDPRFKPSWERCTEIKRTRAFFITSGRFSSGARTYADSVPTRVVLIDGERLASLMIRFGVGVQVRRTVRIVAIDEDFFE